MRKFFNIAAAAIVGFTATAAMADNTQTWMVYCEGVENGQTVAYMSRNTWQAPADGAYATEVAGMASELFGAQGRRPLHGCSSISFPDPALAEYSQEETAALHKRFGTKVVFFDVPEVRTVEEASLKRTAFGRGEISF